MLYIKGAKGNIMSSPFSIPGWNISELKNPNGTRESVGQKQKNVSKKAKTFSKILLKSLIILPFFGFTVLFITNKQTAIKNYVTNFASNITLSDKSPTIKTENNNVVNKEVITVNKTETEENQKNIQTKNVVEQKSKQPVKLPAVIKDYSGNKPWEAFNMIKTDLKTTDNKKVLDSLFDYLCTFSISANNQGLAAVWKNRCGSSKTISELFSYVVNSSGSSVKCYTVKNEGRFWNEVTISGTTIIYDIPNKRIARDNSDYQNGYKY